MANYEAVPNQTQNTEIDNQHQEFNLLKIQADQSKVLEEKGTLSIAREKFKQYQIAEKTGKTALGRAIENTPRLMTRTSVVLTPAFYPNQPLRDPKLVPGIRFTFTLPSENATEITKYKTIPLGELSSQGKMVPADGFSQKDLALAMDMIHGLEQARDNGIVPDLNRTMSDIAVPVNQGIN